jgi:mRNA interferase HigB
LSDPSQEAKKDGFRLAGELGRWRPLGWQVSASRGFRKGLPQAALDAWFDAVRKAQWENTANVKRSYVSASIVTADRIVFNVKGNAYRLVVSVDFDKGIVWIKWIGTQRDYDRIDVINLRVPSSRLFFGSP